MLEGKVIVRLKGGLGNQLFCYAAARRLALVNDAELVIDDVTGFVRDRLYRRRYQLDRFRIPCRRTTAAERLEPFERVRRGLWKWRDRRRPFLERTYVEQEGLDFDRRLLEYRVRGTVYLDGLWQSEGYFKDVEAVIRKDLEIIAPEYEQNQRLGAEIRSQTAVAVHVRWFDPPGSGGEHYTLARDYYSRAMAEMERRVAKPVYVLFSDEPEAARRWVSLPQRRLIVVEHDGHDDLAYADLQLMTQCRHFIIANSTFSWWGAWLGERQDSVVLAPGVVLNGKTAWGFRSLLPERWITL